MNGSEKFCIELNDSNKYLHSTHYANAIIIAIFLDKVSLYNYIAISN